ncbi:phosphatidate cytidylyltransferase [Candidatus Blochmannia ocreatus (nom. nud.)]|uniref:Phosphatidate cytidylyltransferase n=1 Tax=Candidatus Blochmannia ocreatus (nom. nud.) TaxID=251538 RepID=A0ABY4SVH3_9ENTR|nr:phosphatidate cytidylyltransferase [Candidatus Blochmannia ocreatus]URJ25342.1 phosphatidate cytidylyltransferase [Candidatus Blochmannia ocreatus]
MLKHRIISTCILIPVIILTLITLSTTQFSICAAAVCLINAWEWGKIMRFSSMNQIIWISTIFFLLSLIITIVVTQNIFSIKHWKIIWYFIGNITIIWWILSFILIIYYPYSTFFWKKSIFLRYCFGILIILPFFLGILTLHQLHYINKNFINTWWLLYILILVWVNDSSAYIIGRTLGQHKLLPSISPEKTWEGCIGGILISIGTSWLLIKYIITHNTVFMMSPHIIFIYSIISIITSVIGDLNESMFKRTSGIKDSGNIIPGHGGLLDRTDSVTAAIPIFTYLILLDLS